MSERTPAGDNMDALDEQLWDLVYGLLDEEQAAAVESRISSDPQAARAYAEVCLQAEELAAAARLEAPPLGLQRGQQSAPAQPDAAPAAGGGAAPAGPVNHAAVHRLLAAAVAVAAAALLAVTLYPVFRPPPDASSLALLRRAPQITVSGPREVRSRRQTPYLVEVRSLDDRPLADYPLDVELQTADGKPLATSLRTDESGRAVLQIDARKVTDPSRLAVRGGEASVELAIAPNSRRRAELQNAPAAEPQDGLALKPPGVESAGQSRFRRAPARMESGGVDTQAPATGGAGADPAPFAEPAPAPAPALDAAAPAPDAPASADAAPDGAAPADAPASYPFASGAPGPEMLGGGAGGGAAGKPDVVYYRDRFRQNDFVIADLQAKDAAGAPLRGAPIVAEATDGRGSTTFRLQGRTDQQGELHLQVPPVANRRHRSLSVRLGDASRRVLLAEPIPQAEPPQVELQASGGPLQGGTPGELAYRVVDRQGRPAAGAGQLTNSAGDVLATVKSSEGSVELLPQPGEQYWFRWSTPDGLQTEAAVRAAEAEPLAVVSNRDTADSTLHALLKAEAEADQQLRRRAGGIGLGLSAALAAVALVLGAMQVGSWRIWTPALTVAALCGLLSAQTLKTDTRQPQLAQIEAPPREDTEEVPAQGNQYGGKLPERAKGSAADGQLAEGITEEPVQAAGKLAQAAGEMDAAPYAGRQPLAEAAADEGESEDRKQRGGRAAGSKAANSVADNFDRKNIAAPPGGARAFQAQAGAGEGAPQYSQAARGEFAKSRPPARDAQLWTADADIQLGRPITVPTRTLHRSADGAVRPQPEPAAALQAPSEDNAVDRQQGVDEAQSSPLSGPIMHRSEAVVPGQTWQWNVPDGAQWIEAGIVVYPSNQARLRDQMRRRRQALPVSLDEVAGLAVAAAAALDDQIASRSADVEFTVEAKGALRSSVAKMAEFRNRDGGYGWLPGAASATDMSGEARAALRQIVPRWGVGADQLTLLGATGGASLSFGWQQAATGAAGRQVDELTAEKMSRRLLSDVEPAEGQAAGGTAAAPAASEVEQWNVARLSGEPEVRVLAVDKLVARAVVQPESSEPLRIFGLHAAAEAAAPWRVESDVAGVAMRRELQYVLPPQSAGDSPLTLTATCPAEVKAGEPAPIQLRIECRRPLRRVVVELDVPRGLRLQPTSLTALRNEKRLGGFAIGADKVKLAWDRLAAGTHKLSLAAVAAQSGSFAAPPARAASQVSGAEAFAPAPLAITVAP